MPERLKLEVLNEKIGEIRTPDGQGNGGKPAKEKEPIKRIKLEITKFNPEILPDTFKDLKEFMDRTKCSMKDALAFFIDLGSIMYLRTKLKMINQQKLNEEKNLGNFFQRILRRKGKSHVGK